MSRTRPFQISASQVSTFRDCELKWYYQSILRKPRKQTQGARDGEAAHKVREDWLQGKGLSTRQDKVGQWARTGLEELPMPSPALEVEHYMRFEIEGVARVVGKIDVLVPDLGVLGDARFPLPGVPMVLDHKFLASPDYIRDVDTILDEDPQSGLYGYYALEHVTKGAPEVAFFWHHVIKDREPYTIPTRCRASKARVEANYEKVVDTAKKMLPLFTDRDTLRETDIPYNMESCSAYGGCPFRGFCAAQQQAAGVLMNADLESKLGNIVTNGQAPHRAAVYQGGQDYPQAPQHPQAQAIQQPLAYPPQQAYQPPPQQAYQPPPSQAYQPPPDQAGHPQQPPPQGYLAGDLAQQIEAPPPAPALAPAPAPTPAPAPVEAKPPTAPVEQSVTPPDAPEPDLNAEPPKKRGRPSKAGKERREWVVQMITLQVQNGAPFTSELVKRTVEVVDEALGAL